MEGPRRHPHEGEAHVSPPSGPHHHRHRTPRCHRRGRRPRRRRPRHRSPTARSPGAQSLRVATYNLSLNRNAPGQLVADLSTGTNAQAKTVAEIIQRANPDIVLLNEFDYVEGDVAADLFRDNYLEVPQGGADPVEYPYAFVAPSNTGIASGFDLNNNGATVTTPGAPGYGDDAFGFGAFEGQFGMAVLSKHPIADRRRAHVPALPVEGHARARCCPTTRTPPRPPTGTPPRSSTVFRLSSKSHWDVPVEVGGRTVHVLASHPTPPTFDGAEDRNGRRNHDEIRFWADYVRPGPGSGYIYDDAGGTGGLKPGASFVILGDQNADPLDGDSVAAAIDQLLDHPRITDPLPTSAGAVEASAAPGRREPDAPRRPGLRHRRLQRQPRAGQPPRRLRPAVARPAPARRRRCSGRCRPTRCRRSPGPSRSRAATTGSCGSTCGCTADPGTGSASSRHPRSSASGRRGWPATG